MDSVEQVRALGDPTRMRILALIRTAPDGRALVGDLARALDLRQPTVSHHMKALASAGIVRRAPDGRRVWYSIAPEVADRVDALLGADGVAEGAPAPDLDRIASDLDTRFRGVFARETVRAVVAESYDLLAAAGPRPLLASRSASFAASRLEALARVGDAVDGNADDVPTVLFVCVQNAGRSQMAGAILRRLAGDAVRVRTAGSRPSGEVRSAIAMTLDEIGVALEGEFPKPLTDEAVRAADVVITMGCGDACPVYPGRRYLDWDLEDPVGASPARIRAIRDDIEERVRGLVRELLSDRSPAVHPIDR